MEIEEAILELKAREVGVNEESRGDGRSSRTPRNLLGQRLEGFALGVGDVAHEVKDFLLSAEGVESVLASKHVVNVRVLGGSGDIRQEHTCFNSSSII